MIPSPGRTKTVKRLLLILPVLFSCGGDEPGLGYFYSIDVVNATDAPITVWYDLGLHLVDL
jgi:hypothetical protein